MKKINKNGIIMAATISIMLGITGLVIAATAVNLGTAGNFAILAGTGITISGAVNTSTITGDIGTSPTPSITGLGNLVLTGTNHAGDATTISAKVALTTAYTTAASSTPVITIPTELAGFTYGPGVYNSLSGTFGITGTTILDAGGDPNAVFIFQATSTLITAGASHVSLINGAQACNVFWQVGSSATLGAASFFKGSILALTTISLGLGADVEGRLLAQNGAVTLDTNSIVVPTCKGSLKVIKNVVNTGGGIATSSDFTLHVASGTPAVDVSGSPQLGTTTPGTSYLLVAGSYTISELATTTYTQSFSADCPSGVVTLAPSDNKICTVTNTYIIPPSPAVISSGSYFLYTKPIIKIVKVPTPLSLPNGPGVVVYDYYVSNTGINAMSNVTTTDNKCFNVKFISGDSNGDGKLDVNEIWKYSCMMMILETTTNIATASGYADTFTVTDTTNATVVVMSPVVAQVVLDVSTTTQVVPSFPNTGIDPEDTNFLLWSFLTLLVIAFVAVLQSKKDGKNLETKIITVKNL